MSEKQPVERVYNLIRLLCKKAYINNSFWKKNGYACTDLVHECVINYIEKYNKFYDSNRAKETTFALMIVNQTLFTLAEKKTNKIKTISNGLEDIASSDILDEIAVEQAPSIDRTTIVDQALALLPEKYRKIICYKQGYYTSKKTYKEIAKEFSMTKQRARQLYLRGLRQLKVILQRNKDFLELPENRSD